MDPAGILLRTPLFRDLRVDDVEELLPDVRERRFARGEVLWLEGDPATELYVIADGQVKLSRVSVDGREVIIGLQAPVSVTGEVGLFHPRGIRWLNVTAMRATTCLTLRRGPLLSFLSRHPAAMQRMLERLSILAVEVAYSLSGVAFDGIPRRVAAMVLQLARTYGADTADGLRIDVRLSQSELAAHVAASRENVNRALSGLVSSGVISQRAGYFYVHDLAALESAAVEPG